jgi:transposase
MSRLSRLALEVKDLVAAWERGGAGAAIETARRCSCGCRFRHRHGSYRRGLLIGGEILEVTIPRLYCPACRTTTAVLPSFVSRRSPYPTCFRQAAIWDYLTGRSGYRTVASRLT